MKSCIKILHVVPDMAYGGVEKVVLNYYDCLNKSEYIFDFITHGDVQDYHRALIDQGSQIYYFKTIGQLGYAKYKKQVKASVNVGEYDIVHIHTGHITGFYAKVFKSLKARKIICHAHTTQCVNASHIRFMPLFRTLTRHCSDSLVACGREAGRFCFGKAQYCLLPNGVDFNLYKNVTQEEIYKLKEKLKIPKSAFVVGHVGHFSAQKNHDFVVNIIKEYTDLYPTAIFVLVGDGPLKAKIEDSVAKIQKINNVIFTGVRKDIPVLMKLFDAFILPSLYEGLPVVSVEAQAAGTPCLISDTVDPSLDIGARLTVFLPIDKGCKDWVDALDHVRMKFCSKPSADVIESMLIQSGYSLSESAERLKKIYNSLMGEG